VWSLKHPEIHPIIKAEYAKGNVEYKFIQRISDGAFISIGDLLREVELQAGNRPYDHISGNLTIHLPPQTFADIVVKNTFPSLFEGVTLGNEPATVTRVWRFEPNEAVIETEKGPVEIEYLDVEFHIIQRAYPSNIGRLLAYETELGSIANIEELDIPLDENRSIRLTISGKTDNS
jgi:hypothetical protein